MSARFEGGTAPVRLEWVEEQTEGDSPANPDWKGFSFNIENYWNWEPDANTTELRGTGSVKPRGFYNGAETHEASFEYSMARWLLDASGNVQDPAYHAMDVNADQSVKATHTVVSRQEYDSGGSDGAGRRTYVVGKGGHPSTVTLPFETEEGTPITVSLEYQFQKIRPYQISQPSAGTTLDITNNGSTSVDVTVEDEGATTSETITVAAGTTETTLDSYSDIDAVELSTDTDGDVVVTDGAGTEFVTIKGSDSHPADEGDLGIPALGTGSHAAEITEGSEVIFLGDTIEAGDGSAIADEIESAEATIGLGIDDNTQTGTAERNIHATEWSAELTASVAGENVVEQQMVEYLREIASNVVWQSTGGESIEWENGRLQSPGEFAPETGEAKVMLDSVFAFEDITVSNATN